MAEQTNRERATELANDAIDERVSWDRVLDSIEKALDAAHRRGELKGRIAELAAWAGLLNVETAEHAHKRIRELRAELEKTNG